MRFFLFWVLVSISSVTLAETTLKISTLYPPGSAAVTSLQSAAESIRQQTNGNVVLKVYPGGVMGDDSTVMRKMRIGQLHGALLSGTGLDLITDDLKDLSKPFQFDRIEQVYEARQTLDTDFRQRLAEEGWTAFGPLDGGFSYLMSKRPLSDLEAVRNTRLWLPNTRDIQKMADSLNVDYLVMNIGDVLTGLDTGAIDSLIAPPSAAFTLNWHSRFDYITQTPVLYTWGMLVMPDRVFRPLSDAERETVVSALTQWSDELDQRLRADNQKARQAINQLLEPNTFDASDINALRTSQR
ncbi:TRAP transporter substrate-binding protein DctP [Reinekea blandensis]|uniref:DctP (Periplasmic C4-dicarboxylate binding protein) n=1 Tax=Reinekea blandensis MED297 TaxID=314283 RepID=A4B992_9GAMM|nr:TRAP transporter substrate-binding protein DctP [Reinekea blandensis]EAR11193.1 DctP (periplasmic C4-dicarboxylate binding protein) [Reinekea sp. MED297] [Reinekea blandensis MED297]